MNALQKLRQVTDDLPKQLGPKAENDAWALAGRLLDRLPANREEAGRVVDQRDHAGLDALVRKLENPEEIEEKNAAFDAAVESVTQDQMNDAMRAFRKRIKLGRLADESKLGGRYTSGGHKSKIDAIVPPNEFPKEVWAALVKAGKLVHTGHGFYAEPER
jgi:hypothetical protein